MSSKRKRATSYSTASAKKHKAKNTTKPRSNIPIQGAPAQPLPAQTSTLLILLPPELLIHIFTFLLVPSPPRPIRLHSARDRRWRNELSNLVFNLAGRSMPSHYSAPPSNPTAIKSNLLDVLLVSRAFYFAGTAAFFGGNVFRFASASQLARMTRTLDIDRRRHIAHVVLARGTRDLEAGPARIGRDAEGMVDVDVVSLREAVERLPALKEVVVDFEGVEGLGWPRSVDVWRRVRERMEGLEGAVGFLEGKLRWSVDGRRFDPRKADGAQEGERRGRMCLEVGSDTQQSMGEED